MGQPFQNQVDEETIRQTLSAFETAMANTNAAIQSVESVSSSVPWTGEAATRYRTALTDWMAGVRTVQEGLTNLENSMSTHLNVSGNAENEAAANAKWYA